MTVQQLPRPALDPARAYMLPVVREVPVLAGAPAPSPAPPVTPGAARTW